MAFNHSSAYIAALRVHLRWSKLASDIFSLISWHALNTDMVGSNCIVLVTFRSTMEILNESVAIWKRRFDTNAPKRAYTRANVRPTGYGRSRECKRGRGWANENRADGRPRANPGVITAFMAIVGDGRPAGRSRRMEGGAKRDAVPPTVRGHDRGNERCTGPRGIRSRGTRVRSAWVVDVKLSPVQNRRRCG